MAICKGNDPIKWWLTITIVIHHLRSSWNDPSKVYWRSHEKDQLPKLLRKIDSPIQILFLSEESQQIPGTYSKIPQRYKYRRIFFINRCLKVWGMFQEYVGLILEFPFPPQIFPWNDWDTNYQITISPKVIDAKREWQSVNWFVRQ